MNGSLKQKLMDILLFKLDENLSAIVDSALEAKNAATSEESKPENKYDTRGLEASYLAGAQAERTSIMQKEIDQLKRLVLRHFDQDDWIDLTAIVKVVNDLDITKYFFLLPYAGGSKIELDQNIYYVVTPQSPIGKMLFRKKVGDLFSIKNQEHVTDFEVLEII